MQEAEKAMIDTFGSGDFTQLSKLTGADETTLHNIIRNYTKEIPDAGVAIAISNALKVPLHPRYTYHWKGIQKEDFSEFLKWMETGRVEKDENKITKIVLNKNDFGKRMLELAGIPHLFINNEFTVIEKQRCRNIIHDAEAWNCKRNHRSR